MQQIDPELVKNWNILYPAYIDSSLTLAEGRRISKENSVSKPTLQEIAQCLQHLQIKFALEPAKGYPRDGLSRGRIRYTMLDDNGNNNEDIPSSKTHLNH